MSKLSIAAHNYAHAVERDERITSWLDNYGHQLEVGVNVRVAGACPGAGEVQQSIARYFSETKESIQRHIRYSSMTERQLAYNAMQEAIREENLPVNLVKPDEPDEA